MLPLISRRQLPLVGLDISSSCVKLLELSEARRGHRVEAYGSAPLPADAVQDKNITDIEAVGDAIREARKKSGTRTRQAAIAVPGSAAISKRITLPADLSEDDMEAQVKMEADQVIPYPLEEVNLDFEVLGESEDNPSTVNVLVVASRSEHVERRVAAAEAGGLKVRIVDIEPFAVENAYSLIRPGLPGQGNGKTVAVLDIGASMTGLNVFHDNQMVYTREHAFGGDQLTERIMQRYQLSPQEAEKGKRTGNLAEDYATELLDPFKEEVADQVNRFLQFFYSASSFEEIDHIVVGGGTAAINGLADRIAERVGTQASTANPLENMRLSNKISRPMLANDAPSLLIACGLALRSFD